MRRFSAHFIWLGRQVYPMHYLELDDLGRFVGVHPLSEEIAHTSFFNGVLIPLPESLANEADHWIRQWQQIPEKLIKEEPLRLYNLENVDLPAAKLGTDNSGRYRYIQRF